MPFHRKGGVSAIQHHRPFVFLCRDTGMSSTTAGACSETSRTSNRLPKLHSSMYSLKDTRGSSSRFNNAPDSGRKNSQLSLTSSFVRTTEVIQFRTSLIVVSLSPLIPQ